MSHSPLDPVSSDFSSLLFLESFSVDSSRVFSGRSRWRCVFSGRVWSRVAGVGLVAGLSMAGMGPAAAVVVPQVMPAAASGVAGTAGQLGARPGATRLPVSISDSVNASVDVGTGNVMVSVAGLPVAGVGVVGLVGNSRSTERSTTSGLPQRFELTAGSSGALSTVSGGVLYEGGDGFSAKFTSVSGSTTAFTPPKG